MRVVKEAEERKEEILDVAEKLFGTKGFDNTSTNDILEGVGIARGTLYYHFKSKEDILDGVVHEPPIIWLCILLAIPGFIGWILPYYVYKRTVRKKTQKIQPLIEAKYEEMYQVCEKGHSLL